MGKLNGLFEITGSVGDLTFVKTKHGIIVKRRTSLNGNRIAHDPAFKRQRENMLEFAEASRAGKVLRIGVGKLLDTVSGTRVTERITREMVKVIKADPLIKSGSRTVTAEGLSLLEGFDFNDMHRMDSVLRSGYHTSILKKRNSRELTMRHSVEAQTIIAPEAATHFEVVCCWLQIDFAQKMVKWREEAKSKILPVKPPKSRKICLSSNCASGSLPVIALMGIRFIKEIEGVFHPFCNGRHNVLRIVRIAA